MADNLSQAQRHKSMAGNRGRDTKPELLLRSSLHRRGLRFRKNVSALPGKPDIVFPAAQVAVFVDGHFWHGYDFETWGPALSDSWRTKIDSNRRRDLVVTASLQRLGYRVIRVWDHEVERSVDSVVGTVEAAVSVTKDRTPSRTRINQADR